MINIIAGDSPAADHLVRHPDVDMVSFTGSTTVGKLIGQACAEQVKPCVVELGGKSAAIVLEDANVDAIVPTLVGISVGTSQGQSCVCMSRILAPRSWYDEVAGKLRDAFASLKVGDPFEQDTVIGPLVSKAQQERVLAYIRKGTDEGATVATGGKAPDGLEDGFYVEPTLFTDARNHMTIAQEEIFGPVIALIPSTTRTMPCASRTTASTAGRLRLHRRPSHGFEIASRIRTGTFSVNTFAADFNAPFGGLERVRRRP